MISERINSDKAIIGIIAYLILLSCKGSVEKLGIQLRLKLMVTVRLWLIPLLKLRYKIEISTKAKVDTEIETEIKTNRPSSRKCSGKGLSNGFPN